jgi:hypothetical protein
VLEDVPNTVSGTASGAKTVAFRRVEIEEPEILNLFHDNWLLYMSTEYCQWRGLENSNWMSWHLLPPTAALWLESPALREIPPSAASRPEAWQNPPADASQ